MNMSKSMKELSGPEIATRQRRFDWFSFWGYLPDPDPILMKLGDGLSVYRNLLNDAHVWACFVSRAAGTLSREYRIEYPDDLQADGGQRVLDVIINVFQKIKLYRVMGEFLSAPLFGMAPAEITWTSNGGLWIPQQISGKPPEWFSFSSENELRFISRDHLIDGEPVPIMKFMLPRYFPSYLNPFGERLLSRCYWPVVFKRGGLKFWVMFGEKYGMPWTIAKVPRATTDDDRGRILAQLVQMVQDGCAVINNDESVDFVEPGNKSGSSGVFADLIQAANAEISKAILSQTLSTEIRGEGSYAAAQSHMGVRQDVTEGDQTMIKEEFDTLIRWIVELNFPNAPAPQFYFYEKDDIYKDKADRDKTLSEQGVRFTKRYYQRVYGFREDEFAVQDQPIDGAQKELPPIDGAQPEFAEPAADFDALENLAEQAAQISGEITAQRIQRELKPQLADGKDIKLKPSAEFEELLARTMFAAHVIGYGSEIAIEDGKELT